MFIVWILFVVGAGWLLLRASQGQDVLPSSPGPADPPLEILKRRYAKGEISVEEYEKREGQLEQDR